MPAPRPRRARGAGSPDRSHPEKLPQACPGRTARIKIQAVDDRKPKAARWHGVRGGRTVGVEGDLHAAYLRHAPQLLDQRRGRMLVFAAVRAEQCDTVADPAVAIGVAPLAVLVEAYHGRQPAGAVQLGPLIGEA